MSSGFLPAVILATLCACGGGSSSPAAPASPVAPQVEPGRVAGILVDTVAGHPVAGASLTFAGRPPIVTSGTGHWQIEGIGSASNQALAVTGQGVLTRDTTVRWDLAGRSEVRLDVIVDRSPFRLDYYRQFARSGLDNPESLRPIRRWVRAPNFYVDVTNPKTGQRLTPSEIALIEHTLRTVVPQLTGGLFKVGLIETGDGPRSPRSDYIAVTFVHEPDGDFCGSAFVAANPGEITMNYDRCPSACGAFAPETLAHEVGHALGFWHTAGPGIMHSSRRRRCDNLDFSDDERVHAGIVYARPNGNADIDKDPASFVAVESGTPVLVNCSG